MNRSIQKFLVLLLCVSVVLQPFGVKVEAATGAIVYGADGNTAYTLNHQYVKQLNINTGNININATSYTQTNGNSEPWDTTQDAYVIKGQGTSNSSIVIANTNTSSVITVYLVDLQWKGSITVQGNINLVVCGTVSHKATTNTFITADASTSIPTNVTVSCIDDKSVINTNKFFYALKYSINGPINLTINDSVINAEPFFNTDSAELVNLKITNSKIVGDSVSTETGIAIRTIRNALIENSEITNFNMQVQGYTNLTIKNSNLNYFYSFVEPAVIENSFLSNVYMSGGNLTATDSVIFKAYSSSGTSSKLTLNRSSYIALADNKVNYATGNFNHSEFTGTVNNTPVDNNANDVFLKKIRFRDYPNHYILTTFPDGTVSKLYSDDLGYLYPYVPRGSSELHFQVTDETGTVNYGNYELEFDPIQGNDTNSSEPVASQEQTTITTPYKNASIEYSYDNATWYPITTDGSGSFTVILPVDAERIFIRLVPTGETKYAEIIDGVIGVWENAKPIIISQSKSPTTLYKDSEGILYIEAEPFTAGNRLSYQWVKDGVNLSNTSRILSIPMVKQSDAGTYTCIVTESDGKFNTSSPIVVTVKDPDGNTADLLEQIENLTNQVNDLQEQLDEANSDKAILSDTIAQLQNQIVALQTQIIQLQDQIADLEDALSQAGSDKDGLNTIIINLNAQISILNQRIESLENELVEANELKTALQDTVDGFNIQIINLTNQLTIISQELADKEEENAELIGQIADLNNLILELNINIVILQQDLDEFKTINITLQGQLDEANQKVNGFISFINLIKIELGITDDEDILEAIQNLKNQLQGALNNNTQLLDQIHILEAELEAAVRSNTALNDKLEELILLVGAEDSDNIRIKIIELQITITSSNEHITALEQEKAELLIQLQIALDRITELQVQLETLLNSGDSADELREQILLLTQQINQLHTDNETLTVSINNLNLQVIKLTSEKLILEGEIARLESLLATANSTIEELRQQLADLMAEKTILQSENSSLKDENASLKDENAILKDENATLKEENKTIKSENTTLKEELANGGISDKELQDLKEQLDKAKEELENVKQELEKAKNNHNTSSPSTPVITIPDNTVVITPAEESMIPFIIDNEKSEPVSGGKIVAEAGWEVAENPAGDFTPSLSLSQDSYIGIYSFYDKSLNSVQKNHPETQTLSTAKAFPQYLGIGASQVDAFADKNGYVKYTFYARKTADPSKIYQCSFDIKESDYLTPVTSLSSSIKDIVNNYSEINTYDVKVKDVITFTVNADFGSYGRGAILYQLVPANKDFDPDGNWQTVKGNTIKITKITEPVRMYIKYLDKGGNYTVDKTVGFKPVTKANSPALPDEPKLINPVFTLNKTIYLGYEYQVQLTNLGKDSKITYSSSNRKIAKVDKSGTITAVSQGKAIITGTVKQGKDTYKYILNVTVSDGKGDPTLNMITPDISSTGDTPVLMLYKQIKKDSQTKLEMTEVSKDAIVTYLTSNSKIATVSREGFITGKQKGTATITVLITQGGKQYIYLVKVRVDDGTKDEEMYEYLK